MCHFKSAQAETFVIVLHRDNNSEVTEWLENKDRAFSVY